jgi:peroxiredoxin
VATGFVWVAAVVVAVVTAAAFVALSKNPPSPAASPSDPVAHLDNNVREPTGGGLKPSRDLVGQPVPDISFDRFDGQPSTLTGYKGKPLVVNFFSSTCPPCITEMPRFEQLHRALGDQVTVVGIDVEEGETPGRAFIEQMAITYETGRDPDGSVLQQLGGVNLPTTVLITRSATIAEVHSGEISKDDLDHDVREKLLS